MNKDLLFKYLCMALPYGVKVNVGEDMAFTLKKINENGLCEASSKSRMTCYTKLPLPYLRPMSSMTDKEKAELLNLLFDKDAKHFYIDGDGVIDSTMSDLMEEESIYPSLCPINMVAYTNWLLENHFDFMGLIPKGLAIEVTKDDNPYE